MIISVEQYESNYLLRYVISMILFISLFYGFCVKSMQGLDPKGKAK